ncbi:YheC/YheD family protein, partial [Thermodesulfobacteriota bacterium]
MEIAFLMDRLESIQPENETTSYLMYECNQRGHSVYFLEPHDVYIKKNEVVARMRNITVPPDLSMKKYWRSLIKCLKKDELIFENITDLDALFLRKDPPLNYQTMEFLDPVNEKIFMINSTRGQIIANSKLYTLNFPDFIPETHISRDPIRLKKVIDDFGGAMVVKPLQRYGGEGVIKVSVRDRENLSSLINYYVRAYQSYPEREPIMVQEYLDLVQREGDVRILMLNGEILGAMRRKAQEGEFRTNIHSGAKAYKHDVTIAEKRVCMSIRDRLIEDGLFFVGIDLIGDKLVEINCVSPGGIPRINRLEKEKFQETSNQLFFSKTQDR